MRRYYFQEKNSYKAKKGVKKQANTELSITTELSHLKWKFSQASVVALDFVACQSKKRANIGNICLACLCSPSSDDLFSCCETAGYVRFALFTSGYGYSPPSATLA